jgi:hypothetical protein
MANTNIRIVADNAIDRATLTASSTAGALIVSNLLTDKKSEVWRATSTSATLTATWTDSESISCVALPFCNLSPTATIRVRGYSDTAGTVQVLDTGTVSACPAPAVVPRGWTAAQAASAYAYGGGAVARCWFTAVSVKRLVIDIVDTSNLQGYIEAAFLLAGAYWSPEKNASNIGMTPVDLGQNYRTAADDLRTDAGTSHKTVQLELGRMTPADRAKLVGVLRNSRAYPILVSGYPGSSDLELERDYTIYGKRSADSDVALQYAITYSTQIPIESV